MVANKIGYKYTYYIQVYVNTFAIYINCKQVLDINCKKRRRSSIGYIAPS